MNAFKPNRKATTIKAQRRGISTTSKKASKSKKIPKKLPSQATSSPLTILSTPKRTFFKTTKATLGGCGSSCGCGPEDGPEQTSQQTPQEEQQQQQYNDQQVKTMEKMRKQQRDFSLRLYRSILREHRHLPPEMRMLGDPYVKEEFRLHKNAKPEHLQPFYEQWIDYLGHLRNASHNPEALGQNIPIETIDQLDDEQKQKLFTMHDETYRIFGGELNETDIGLTLDQVPEHVRSSGIFGDAEQQNPEAIEQKSFKLTTATTETRQKAV
jgi:hypothetical protein